MQDRPREQHGDDVDHPDGVGDVPGALDADDLSCES
jgi:hypothetical protein